MDERVTDVGINPLAAKNITRWRFNPEAFAREALGFKPSNQQVQAYAALKKLVRAKLIKQENQKRELLGKQLVAMTAEDDVYSKKMGISVMSGKGTGKDAWVATLIPWFMVCFSRGKIPITGPSYDQLKDVLMPEISKWMDVRDEKGKSKCRIKELIEVKAEKVVRKDKDGQLRSFAHIRTVSPGANVKQQEAVLGGWHEDYLMVIADEASGVPDGVLQALENTMSSAVNFAILIFNPNRNEGFAYDTHYGRRASKWIQLHWDSRKSNLVDREQLQNLLDIYGADGPEYRIFVCGLPPENEPDALIQRDWVMSSQDRHMLQTNYQFEKEQPDAPLIMGIDVARTGKDKSVILVRRGRRIIDLLEASEPDSSRLADLILLKISEHSPTIAYIDTIGIGGPVYDFVRIHWKKLRGVDVSRKAKHDRYRRLRDELWWKMRKRFEAGTVDIPGNPVLRNELTSIRWKTTEKGQIKIESKEEMRKRNMPSPNIADALMLTMMANDTALAASQIENKKDAYEIQEEENRRRRYRSPIGWMRR